MTQQEGVCVCLCVCACVHVCVRVRVCVCTVAAGLCSVRQQVNTVFQSVTSKGKQEKDGEGRQKGRDWQRGCIQTRGLVQLDTKRTIRNIKN